MGLASHVLELFERKSFDLHAGRFGGNVHGLAWTERIGHALLGFARGLLDRLDLQEAR